METIAAKEYFIIIGAFILFSLLLIAAYECLFNKKKLKDLLIPLWVFFLIAFLLFSYPLFLEFMASLPPLFEVLRALFI